MLVDWNSDVIRKWKEEAVTMQQGYFHLFGKHTWREYKPPDYSQLKRNIGFAMFGLPKNEGNENVNGGTGYTDKQFIHINKIFYIIKELKEEHNDQENIWVSFLFVMGKVGDYYKRFSVIRIPENDLSVEQNNSIFIDAFGQVYKDWEDYLNNNTLPDCVICYPKGGIYSARNECVEVEFGISVRNVRSKFLKALDLVRPFINIGASMVKTAAIFSPVPVPVIKGTRVESTPAGRCAFGRNMGTSMDCRQRQQSIGLDNAESRSCWLGIAGCLMSLATGYGTTAVNKTVQTGDSISLTTKFAVKSVTVSSCIVNAIAVTSGLKDIIKKIVNKEKITNLEIFQFTSAVLFLTNSVISAQQAFTFIDSIGKNSTIHFSNNTERKQNQSSEIVTQTNIYKSIPQFVSGCSSAVKFTGGSLDVRSRLLEITNERRAGLISESKYRMDVEELLQTYWKTWNEEMAVVAEKICTALGGKNWLQSSGVQVHQVRKLASIVIAERKILEKFVAAGMPTQHSQVCSSSSDVGTSSHIDNGSNSSVCEEMASSVSYDDEVINILAGFVDRQICKDAQCIPVYMTFICKYVKRLFQEEKSRYEKIYEIVRNHMSVEEFYKKYEIIGNPNNHFINEVFRKFKDGEKLGYCLLKWAYEDQNDCAPTEENHGQSSSNVNGVSLHPFCNEHGLASNGLLSKEQYCEIAAELTGQQADMDSIYISECGTTAVLQVNAGADIVMVQGLLEDGKVSGNAALLHSA